jgi:hypothetical protein
MFVRIYVYGVLNLVLNIERRQKGNPLRASAPDDGPAPIPPDPV